MRANFKSKQKERLTQYNSGQPLPEYEHPLQKSAHLIDVAGIDKTIHFETAESNSLR